MNGTPNIRVVHMPGDSDLWNIPEGGVRDRIVRLMADGKARTARMMEAELGASFCTIKRHADALAEEGGLFVKKVPYGPLRHETAVFRSKP